MSIFKKIITGEIPSYKVYEDDKTLAFLDIHPNVDGHTLVIHKTEFKNIFDAPEKELQELIVTVSKVAKILQAKLKCDGMNITVNNGEIAGQEVPHMHFHLLPRYKDDGINPFVGYHQNEKSKKPLEEIIKILQ